MNNKRGKLAMVFNQEVEKQKPKQNKSKQKYKNQDMGQVLQVMHFFFSFHFLYAELTSLKDRHLSQCFMCFQIFYCDIKFVNFTW